MFLISFVVILERLAKLVKGVGKNVLPMIHEMVSLAFANTTEIAILPIRRF